MKKEKDPIHIKAKNKGKLTKKIGKITDAKLSKAAKSDSPALRKEAVFAENARKWNKK
jgi:hypothetical protein